ncbi:ABC transporter ATP-binding protein [Haloferax mediterranei ATCC 33500]|uniref:ABC-type D-xylose/L-arabinose transporter n=1 Tax=Haloferax mediterranei (strain ATCC 33500 / DSM 1411 / JCM 8866 / NBRC 14739 / NCIMB 2177 / R-4) TaxID=523841 RepID=I3R8K3_HALMT|nr:ABC transporter ATP-binding protein [Haloferax mediterranei]AFK20563.1 sugar ABC transporter ATP-binding protein (UGPC) [Haloferax mediterranei ATCC 33500]AHZ23920.1 sugar ABC transporter ATP-binding protein [Haloferax mediterranei ATCC 33500]ELZ98345.1 sugar ABC transporter ATP-binding protein [Haloferax mediterranei ATCC 33500]MDX5986682.1 ABC transporter ATP-binding protein [Haloferax mediterranei ATCC 33500]QCQ76010.1 ABC transporter ATP-binding protein [Haloferax mediterranei ATCC 3350
MADLTLDHVSKFFDDGGSKVVAVDDASVTIEDGEFLVLVGPSGCGKSTTLRMIAGLETVSEGQIRLGDERMDNRPPRDRDIAMVFQSYALYPHMSVRGNMRFGLEESTDMADADIDAVVEETADMLGIADLLDRKPGELSGGQQQRVALGRAIVRDPEVFLMDEPLSNLDAKLRSQMRTELQRLQEELGVTTVYVTHDQTEAMTMGDRIAILNDGELQQVATPLEAYHRPANRFVAGFIGEPSMNFFEMEVHGDTLANDTFTYDLSPRSKEAVEGTSRVTLGIRPEDVELVSDDELDHTYETSVDVVEPMGNENAVYLEFGTERRFVATVGGMRRVEAGQSAVARLPEEAIHLFDAATGEALQNRSLESADLAEPEPRA